MVSRLSTQDVANLQLSDKRFYQATDKSKQLGRICILFQPNSFTKHFSGGGYVEESLGNQATGDINTNR